MRCSICCSEIPEGERNSSADISFTYPPTGQFVQVVKMETCGRTTCARICAANAQAVAEMIDGHDPAIAELIDFPEEAAAE